jgi:hypothetical protein
MAAKRTHWKNLRNSKGLREKKIKEAESHPMFQKGTEANLKAKVIFDRHRPFICSKYTSLCRSYGASCTRDDIHACLLDCWRRLRKYDPSRGKPITFLAVCVRRCLISRFEYEYGHPVEFAAKQQNPLIGPQDYIAGLRDDATPFVDMLANKDDLRLVEEHAAPGELEFLRWYFARPSHTPYDLANNPPPLPIPTNLTARFYTERKRMIIDRIRKRMGLLSPSE